MKLSALFNGEQHWLEPGTDFSQIDASSVVVGWEDLEEEDELSPFEYPSQEPILEERKASYQNQDRTDFHNIEQSWGSFSIALTGFAQICGVGKKQYQHGTDPATAQFSFQSEENITERM